MKIGGRTLTNNNLEIVVLPRSDGDIAFMFKPVLDSTVFEQLVKEPEIPFISDAQGSRMDPTNEKYRKALVEYYTRKGEWMFLESISATANLEWETVVLNDPLTWKNTNDELKAAGISEFERGMLVKAFDNVNSLNQSHLDEARNRFLASMQDKSIAAS